MWIIKLSIGYNINPKISWKNRILNGKIKFFKILFYFHYGQLSKIVYEKLVYITKHDHPIIMKWNEIFLKDSSIVYITIL